MELGSRIAQRRLEINMTTARLAKQVDVSVEEVEAWERQELLPRTDQLRAIANALQTKISWLMGENDLVESRWELHDAMFSVDHMLHRVKMYALDRNMIETQKAIELMLQYHKGQKRKGKDQVPYVSHPLMMACHAFALEIGTDDLVAAILLHDVLEDCDVTADSLNVNTKIREVVELVSFFDKYDENAKESKKLYYERIGKNKYASMVKILDRCNNISQMATCFGHEKMADYIDETETYILPILDIVKHRYPEYYNAAFLLKYQLVSVMESLKRTI